MFYREDFFFASVLCRNASCQIHYEHARYYFARYIKSFNDYQIFVRAR